MPGPQFFIFSFLVFLLCIGGGFWVMPFLILFILSWCLFSPFASLQIFGLFMIVVMFRRILAFFVNFILEYVKNISMVLRGEKEFKDIGIVSVFTKYVEQYVHDFIAPPKIKKIEIVFRFLTGGFFSFLFFLAGFDSLSTNMKVKSNSKFFEFDFLTHIYSAFDINHPENTITGLLIIVVVFVIWQIAELTFDIFLFLLKKICEISLRKQNIQDIP